MKLLQELKPWLLAAGMAMIGATAWADGARIAVAAEAAHAEAPVSSVAARAPHILIFDASGAMVESHPNPAAANPGGAGPALARWLADKKVGTLIAGDFGAKLSPALEEGKIRTVTASGPAAQAVKKVLQ
ncbi:MAG: NifB/NifX family molybdenum-iron cluster-binding protein [Burkholderiales bacterium]